MNFKELVVVACAGLTLAGCANGEINLDRPFQTEPAAPASAGDRPLRQAQIPLDRLLRSTVCNEFTEENGQQKPRSPKVCGEQGAAAKLELTELIARVAKTPTKDQTRIRNEVVGQLLFSSTANCNIYLQSVRNGQVATRTGSDFLSSTMGFLGSIATTEADAGMFAGLSGLSTAIGASADRNIFAEVGVELIADEIYKIRAEQRARIEGKLGLPYASWPIGLAMTDVYEFHGSCSLLKGLSAMRTAVATRDAAVKAARGAAVEAARAGGDGNAVAAAVVGVEQAFSSTAASTSAGLRTAAPAGLTHLDLEAMEKAALECLTSAQQRVSPDKPVTAEQLLGAATGACRAPDANSPEWRLRYVAFVRAELEQSVAVLEDARAAQAAGPGLTAASQILARAEEALAGAKAAPAATDEAEVNAQQTRIAELTADRDKAMAALATAKAVSEAANAKLPKESDPTKALPSAFLALGARIRVQIAADISYVSGVRSAVVQYGLTAGEQGATAAQVVTGQTQTAGDLATKDPVIRAMIAAAKLVADDPTTVASGLMAAKLAQAQAQSYLVNYQGG